MRKLFYAVVALSLFATSCAKDEAAAPEATAKTKTVTFSVKAPELKTRAAGDGMTATKLYYAFYDETMAITNVTGTVTNATDATDSYAKQFTVEATLVEGKSYTAIFWAQSPTAKYTVDMTNKTVTIPTTLAGNSEDNDAFWKVEEINVTESFAPADIVLTRPFAQLNIGASNADIENADDAGVNVASVKLVVKQVNTVFNLADGTSTTPQDITFDWATVGSTTYGDPASHEILSVNYVLVDNTYVTDDNDETVKALNDIQFYMSEAAVADDETYADAFDRTYANVPFQINHRTYVLGSVITSTNTPYVFTVKTAPGFETGDNVENR